MPERTQPQSLAVRIIWGAVAIAVYASVIALIHCLATQNWVVISGVSSLGLLTGVLVAFFVQEAEKWDYRALGISVAALATSGVLALLRFAEHDFTTSDSGQAIWFYPIGLVVGVIRGTVWDWKHDEGAT